MNRTPVQSETSRRNGAKSTGPVTAAGRERAAANSTRHGILSNKPVLPSESEADLDALMLAWKERFKPVGEIEEDLVREMAMIRWRLRRVVAFESRVMAEGDVDQQIRGVAAATRYETRLQRITWSLPLAAVTRLCRFPDYAAPAWCASEFSKDL